MTEESVAHTVVPASERRLSMPRGWLILGLALASWAVFALLFAGVWWVFSG